MVAGSAAIRPALTRDEARTLLGPTMWLLAGTAGAFAFAHLPDHCLSSSPGRAAFDFHRLCRSNDLRTARSSCLDLPHHPQRVPPAAVGLRRER